jgi:hypothetical protein
VWQTVADGAGVCHGLEGGTVAERQHGYFGVGVFGSVM